MGRLTIQDIAKVLVTKNGLKQSEANRFATELFAVILERLEKNDLVKVKGLGTWKVITVEARESISVRTGDRVMIDEHSKITFTPDATMKELVNKPFSQFETVVLNDNVEFDDMKEQSDDTEEFEDVKDDLTEEELEQLKQLEEPVIDQEEPVMQVAEKPIVEEPTPTPVVAPLIEVPEEEPAEEEPYSERIDEEEEEKSVNWLKWVWLVLGAICLIGVSAAGGYYYGRQQTTLAAMSDTVYVRDTVYMSENQDSTISNIPPKLVPEKEVPVVESPKVEEVKDKQPKAEAPKVEKPKAEPAPEVDKYAEKDERVRLGAYRIVGLDHEVTVLQGQTFYSICRAHLGPDMECYIEVYNNLPRNPQIKAGQVIKIPKLQLKKRKKQ